MVFFSYIENTSKESIIKLMESKELGASGWKILNGVKEGI